MDSRRLSNAVRVSPPVMDDQTERVLAVVGTQSQFIGPKFISTIIARFQNKALFHVQLQRCNCFSNATLIKFLIELFSYKIQAGKNWAHF